jgi:hypothetical protein
MLQPFPVDPAASDGAAARTEPREPSPAATRPEPPAHAATAPGDDAGAFDALRRLLLGNHPSRLADLEQRLDDPELRAAALAEVLPQAIHARANADPQLAEALLEPVDACLHRSVARDPSRLADALFPVIGPAIRRAIAETLKGLVQSINQVVEHSLSARGLRWRWEAWRSGRPFGEVVLSHMLVYRVEAAYLIHNETGLLVDHAVAATETTLKDEDAVSAMLTAIQDFVQESFSTAGHALETVEIGPRTLWLLRGPHATLACAISGLPPRSLRGELEAVLRRIHAGFGAGLAHFDGDKARLRLVHPLLEECLALEYRDGGPAAARIVWWPWLVALALLLAGLGWAGWQSYDWQRRVATARAELAATPGLALLDWQPGREIRAALLADPLSAAVAGPPAERVQDPRVRARLRIEAQPYVSADPAIVLERARRQLRPPPGVTLDLDAGVLHVQGTAPADWISRVRAFTLPPAGVDALDIALTPDLADLARRVRAAIEPPPTVRVELDGTALRLSGAAATAWIGALPMRLAGVAGLTGCTTTGLVAREAAEARGLAAELEQLRLLFGEDSEPLPGGGAVLERGAALMQRLAALADALPGARVRVVVIGHSDGLGAPARNQWLRAERAAFAATRWRALGVPAALLATESAPGFEPATVARPAERRVDLRVDLRLPEPGPCLPPRVGE